MNVCIYIYMYIYIYVYIYIYIYIVWECGYSWWRENKRIDEEGARATHSVGWDHVKFWCTLILTNVCNRRHASPTAGSNPRKNFVSITAAGEQATDGQQWRGARQPRATACCRVQPRDTVCSHACACWIMLATCIHLLCSSDKRKKSVAAQSARALC